jgi:lysyl-tRNA synthetase class II
LSTAERGLVQPTFAKISTQWPCRGARSERLLFTDRFELFIGMRELANAFGTQ